MPVNYTAPAPEQLFPVSGVKLGTAGAGIEHWTRDDVALGALYAAAQGWHAAARALMTTDNVAKGASRRVDVEGVGVTVTGNAKGAGMMSPNMATMLGFVATDAPIAGRLLSGLVTDVADASFNRITVDGDSSTNDSFIVITSGKAPMEPIARADDSRLVAVSEAIHAVAVEP